ncbi:MAG: VWA domain-containing protein [Bryobacteraceae bacterium]
MRPGPVIVLSLAWIAGQAADAATVRVVNPTGNISAKVTASPQLRISRTSPDRAARDDDVSVTRKEQFVLVECRPSDGARVDLQLELPYGLALEAKTDTGDITVSGFFQAALITEKGGIQISAPWAGTRIEMLAKQEPASVMTPAGFKFSHKKVEEGWFLRDTLPQGRIAYGRILIQATAPKSLTLSDAPIPEDSPVKMHWQAPEILEGILTATRAHPAAAPAPSQPKGADDGLAVFRSDVRLVNLSVAVFDSSGQPMTGLKAADFEVFENKAPQQVTFASAEEVPFNLAFLMDLSGSTRRDRDAMKEASRKLIELTRAHDRVAAYALAEDRFVVVQRLTNDRRRVQAAIEHLPNVSGGSPVYDAIVMSYAEELRKRPGERNALVVLSDGVDNQIQGVVTPSEVSFRKLRRAADLMDTLIYPIVLSPFDKVPPPGWARRAEERMQELAAASGGRLFRANSIRELDPVYPQLAAELRSVYTVAYYPKDQNFDGRWRPVEVRVNRPGARVRTRAGYAARPN